jgi:capsular exopolysaccharide synthesis family protein
MSEIGKLSQSLKSLLMDNIGELSSVQANLLSASSDKDIKTLFITSCYALEGKTISAISMAYGLSTNANAKVLLVDGNPYSPKIHELFNVNRSPGLSDMLLSKAEYNELLIRTEYENLAIIPNGTKVSNMIDIFRSETFKDKLNFLKQRVDYLILDGPSVLSSSDASVISKHFDGVILVVECEKTRWEVVQLAKDRIDKIGGNILGIILNRRKYYIPKALYGKI